MNKDIIAEDAPKFIDLLHGIKEIAEEILPVISNLSKQVDSGDITIKHGVSLLDVKNNTLLMYILDLVSVVLNKVNGTSVASSDFVNRLIEYRTVLEKIRPLEQKLKYQIDKTIQASTNAAALAKNDPLQLKPNLDNFEDSEEEEEDQTIEALLSKKKYVPPHIAAVAQEEEHKRQSKLEKAKRRALTKSSIIADLVADSSDMPTEYSQQPQFQSKVLRIQGERKRFEEENFTRMGLSKKEKAIEKRLMRKSELDTITSFGSVSILHGDGTDESSKKKRKKMTPKRGNSKKRR